jgi:hypothetical protein
MNRRYKAKLYNWWFWNSSGATDTTPDGKQLFLMGGDSIYEGASEGTTNTPIPGAGVLYESTGSVLNAVDAAYISSNLIGKGMAPQFAINYNADTGYKVVICNGAKSGSSFNNVTAGLSWDTNGTLYAAFVTKARNTMTLMGVTVPKKIFFNLGINDGSLTLAQITGLIDRLTADFPGVDIVFNQIGDDAVRTNPVSKRNLLKQAVMLYSHVYIGANNAALLGAGMYQPSSPHPTQIGCNMQGAILARWMRNSSYSKWGRSAISSLFDELGMNTNGTISRKDLLDNFVTALGPSYFSLEELLLFKVSNANNIFCDLAFLQQPQNPGAAVLTLNDSIATNGTTYLSEGWILSKLQIAGTQDNFSGFKIKTNSTPAGTLAYAFGGQFTGNQLLGIKQRATSDLMFSCFDANSGVVYATHTSFQNNTAYICARNSGNELGYVNGAQVFNQTVSFVGTPSTPVIGGLNTANTYPAATLASGITASFEYFVSGKQSTMNHATLYSALETLMTNW